MRVRLALTIIVAIGIVVLSLAKPVTAVDVPAAASPGASPVPCPLTQPNGNSPSDFDIEPGGYGNDALWTNLSMWSEQPGVVAVPDDGHMTPDGVIHEMKWAWFRYKPGKLTIEGRRLDAPAPPLEAWVPDGYGDRGFQVSGLTFPTAGCWEITGRLGDASLTFVVIVVPPPTVAARDADAVRSCLGGPWRSNHLGACRQ
jgi:hypothetical protein